MVTNRTKNQALIVALVLASVATMAKMSDAGIVSVTASSGKTYTSHSNVQNGELIYIDRDYTYLDLDASLFGLDYIRTSNSDKSNGTLTVDVTLDSASTLYVGVDGRTSPAQVASSFVGTMGVHRHRSDDKPAGRPWREPDDVLVAGCPGGNDPTGQDSGQQHVPDPGTSVRHP